MQAAFRRDVVKKSFEQVWPAYFLDCLKVLCKDTLKIIEKEKPKLA